MREKNAVEFRGYYPGVLGEIVRAHASYYHDHWGFDLTFESQVAAELGGLMGEFRGDRDYLRVALAGGGFAGSVALDGRRARGKGARLRWFLVLPKFQGLGIGRELLSGALAFCREKGYPKAYLWTFKGLETARHLYEGAGFRPAQEHEVDQWGRRVIEQRYDLIFG